MCKALSFIVCENVQLKIEKLDNGEIVQKPQIINPLDTITMLSIPSYFSFAIFGNVTDFDCNKTSGTIYVVIYSPNGSELFKSKEMKLPNFDEQRVGLKFSFDFRNFTFDSCGEYQVKLFVYDKCIAETQFTVEKRSE